MIKDDLEITPEMIEAGYREVLQHDADIYDTTPPARMERMLKGIYRAMWNASGRDGRVSGV